MVSQPHVLTAASDFERWLQSGRATAGWNDADLDRLRRARDAADALLPGADGGLQAADLLASLGLDADAVVAALLNQVYEHGLIDRTALTRDHGEAVTALIVHASDLYRTGDLYRRDRSPEQLERLRQMLLAMAQDVRVVLLMLAARLSLMRTSARSDPTEQRRFAQETLNIYAPLANRLGIGQIKWELEDLALRDLQPDIYKTIARALDERRADREAYIQAVVKQLRAALAAAGIDADVSGRAKHIYSIWNKMQRKKLLFNQLFDVRALRIMVATRADCYSALGVVHSTWKNVHDEFDDYIANPKRNGYRSLHTAVIGPTGKTIEVQIRTREMHRHAEYGIAAHWRYKEGGGDDQTLNQQIQRFRQMLDVSGDADALLDEIDGGAARDRVYVRTPKGDVVDLAAGATPLDFAYHVHTELGHRCRGAKVNGRIVPLHQALRNGDRVEVLTVKEGKPSRDWLSPHSGYLGTARARAKVRHWFRQLDRDKNVAAGRQALEQEFRRLNIALKSVDLGAVAARFNLDRADDLYAAIGSGDLTTAAVCGAFQHQVLEPRPTPVSRRVRAHDEAKPPSVRGVGNLLTQFARCCSPVPYEPVVGYITLGRGVSIHRSDCPNALSLRARHPQRFIDVDWGEDADSLFSANVHIEALDRPGLLRDVTTVLANDRVNVLGVNTYSDQATSTARMDLRLEIKDVEQLSRVLVKLGQLSNVLSAQRG